MLRTPVCELLGIDVPIVQAAIAPYTSPELAAAVANAGGLGSLGTVFKSVADIRSDIERTRSLTSRPFVVNFTRTLFDEAVFAAALKARPPLISLALGAPGELVERAHAAGARVIHQVHTVAQAQEAAAQGADVLIAQGSEAGGFGGPVAGLTLVPQVVDAISPRPVLAAGGIADGRGIAATLVLGAQGVNIGTRFLASEEAPIPAVWKQRILAAASEDAIRVEFMNDLFPPPPTAYTTAPRALRTAFIERWQGDREELRRQAASLRQELLQAIRDGRSHEFVPFTGQTAGAIHEILPAAEIVRRLMVEAEQALQRVGSLR